MKKRITKILKFIGIVLVAFLLLVIIIAVSQKDKMNKIAHSDLFGYSNTELKTIYEDVVLAERRAQEEAEDEYPLDLAWGNLSDEKEKDEILTHNVETFRELQAIYKGAVLEEYALTNEQFVDILERASEERWWVVE